MVAEERPVERLVIVKSLIPRDTTGEAGFGCNPELLKSKAGGGGATTDVHET